MVILHTVIAIIVIVVLFVVVLIRRISRPEVQP